MTKDLLWMAGIAGVWYLALRGEAGDDAAADGTVSGYEIALPDKGVSDVKRDWWADAMREEGADKVVGSENELIAIFHGISKKEARRIANIAPQSGVRVRVRRFEY